MKKEQLKDKFIVCRTQDEADFVVYWVEKLLGYNIGYVPCSNYVCIRLKPARSMGKFGYASKEHFYKEQPEIYGHVKEEECSVLFGNLIKGWKNENRT